MFLQLFLVELYYAIKVSQLIAHLQPMILEHSEQIASLNYSGIVDIARALYAMTCKGTYFEIV